MTSKTVTPVRRIIGLLSDYKPQVALLVVFIVIAQAGNIAVPFVSKVLIDTLTVFIQTGGVLPTQTIIWCAVGILVLTVISSISSSAYNYKLFRLITTLEDKIRNLAFEKYLQLHALFHHGSSSGQVIGRIERGGGAVYVILNDLIGQSLLPPLVVFIGTFSLLLYKNVFIALAVLVPFPIYLLITRRISQKIYSIEQNANEAFERVAREQYDVASNVLTVKKFSQESAEVENKVALMQGARNIQYEAERLWGVIENIQTVLTTTGRVVVLGLSAWLVLQGQATIGDFVLYITLQTMAYQPLAQLSNIFPRMRRNTARVERLFALLDEPVSVLDVPNAQALPPLSKQIEFKDVSFAYHIDGEPALRDLNLIIPAGKTVALVGRSGSGKTTFINLLMRSYDPQKGQILVDGVDIRTATQESLRAQIAVVPQEVDLFSRTIAENIAYGKPEVTEEHIESAAKTALAHDFIAKLEEGYKTVVGERGIKLSGGERQRVGIARAVLRDPRILILDEATSHLDTESERLISKATDALVKDRTSIIIAHRLSTVLHADTILVFSGGVIEAQGTHSELLKTSPTYARLHSLQFAE